MAVKILKLITGEEIVGEIVVTDENNTVLKNPLSIVLRPSQDGFTFGFVPWCNLMEGDKTIPNDKVLTSGDAADDVKNAYNSMFGGIVTPPKQLIV